jgi:hypothetical protein
MDFAGIEQSLLVRLVPSGFGCPAGNFASSFRA